MIIDYRRCMSVGMIPVIVAEVNGGIVRIRHCSWLFFMFFRCSYIQTAT